MSVAGLRIPTMLLFTSLWKRKKLSEVGFEKRNEPDTPDSVSCSDLAPDLQKSAPFNPVSI